MAPTTKSRQAGEAEVERAISERQRWEAAAASARAGVAAAGAIVPDSPDDLDRVASSTVAARGRMEAAEQALARAVDEEAGARRALLHRIADDTAVDRQQVERDAHALDRKIVPLLRSLRDLDDVDYGPAPMATYADGTTVPASEADLARFGRYTVQTSRRTRLATRARELIVREGVLRFVADHGESPVNGRALIGTRPIPDTDVAITQAGLAFPWGFNPVPLPDEAAQYLAWLRPVLDAEPSPEGDPSDGTDGVAEDADAFADLDDLLGDD